jgi:predicted HicB family RNase H-like nuclease
MLPMELAHHISAIQSDLAAAAALGGEATADAGRRLSDALESSLQLRLLDVLTEAALGLNASLPDGHVEVRLAGRDPELVYVEDVAAPAEPAAADDDMGARITLRLPEALKGSVEAAANREGVSTNTWVVRALKRSLEPRARTRTGNRIQGFART